MTFTINSKTIFIAVVIWWAILQFIAGINTWDASTFLIAGMATAAAHRYIFEAKHD